MARHPATDLNNSSCLLALVFASTDDIYYQVQKTEASKEPEEVTKMPFVQVVRNPSRVPKRLAWLPAAVIRGRAAQIVPEGAAGYGQVESSRG